MDTSQKLYDYIVVGGGISGLTTAYFLKKRGHSVLLLEKERQLGGWIQTEFKQGYLIERGPHALRPAASTLSLISELGLEEEILWMKPQKRYLYNGHKLVSFQSLLFKHGLPLIKELFHPPKSLPEETIASFSLRHFGPWITENIVDPLTLGIYGGDIHRLSVDRCFPLFKTLEREKGSVIRGLFAQKKQKHPLFTFKRGMQTLIEGLQNALEGSYLTNSPVLSMTKDEVWAAVTPHSTYHSRHLIKAIPALEERLSLSVVTLCYDEDLLRHKGFGFLVPSRFGLSLLGAVFDSELHQNKKTQISFMMRPCGEKEAFKVAYEAAHKILGITQEPQFFDYFLASHAIPQYTLGIKDAPPVGVNACITAAERSLRSP